MSQSDEILQTLAFQRGVLTLLRGEGAMAPSIEKAIEGIDTLIERLGREASR